VPTWQHRNNAATTTHAGLLCFQEFLSSLLSNIVVALIAIDPRDWECCPDGVPHNERKRHWSSETRIMLLQKQRGNRDDNDGNKKIEE